MIVSVSGVFALTTIKFQLTFQLIFDGTVGNGSRGDIAIDDVSVKPGNCTGPPATDNPGISQVTYGAYF